MAWLIGITWLWTLSTHVVAPDKIVHPRGDVAPLSRRLMTQVDVPPGATSTEQAIAEAVNETETKVLMFFSTAAAGTPALTFI